MHGDPPLSRADHTMRSRVAMLCWYAMSPLLSAADMRVWLSFTPGVAVIARPTISPVAAMATVAVIHLRPRRVIATSLCAMRPAVWGL